MNIKKYFKAFTLIILILFTSAEFSYTQTSKSPAPRVETLLNDMKLLVWKAPNEEKITYKIRIHTGAAFDREDKEGTIALLAKILFPYSAAKDSFEEDYGGSLDVEVNYDYIQINATSDKESFLTVLELLGNTVINPQIDKETTAIVKTAQIEELKELEANPQYVADQAVAKRLFGDFPYGRPVLGTAESLSKIDFADLIFAKQRFLTSDNATLSVSGDVKPDYVYKAVRRYFGNWIKADDENKAYFRVPDKPVKFMAVQDSPTANTSEFRFAFRGLARNDKDYFASIILTKILQNRLNASEPNKMQVKQMAHLLPGYVLVSSGKWNLGIIQKRDNAISLPMGLDSMISNALKEPISQAEFDKEKNIKLPSSLGDYTEWWLDVDTFKLDSVKEQIKLVKSVTLEDVKRVAENWKKEPVAGVLVFKERDSDEPPALKSSEKNTDITDPR